MSRIIFVTNAIILLSTVFYARESHIRPVHTYSIVAHDTRTGEMGVAVQSHWFSVGSVVSWAEAGVGAVATQSFAEVSYGPLGLELMRGGKTAPEALKALLSIDEHADVRQVAMVDASGLVTVHTGKKCLEAAGHITGPGYSCQANMMEKATVWHAMARAYESAKGDLLDKLMAALEAAQAEGGDIRGKQSAAILIVPGTKDAPAWQRTVDLRIEDHPDPITEMKRLVTVHRAYVHMNKGDELMTKGDLEGALEEYAAAEKLYPENIEMPYWTAIGLVNAGQVDKVLPMLKKIFDENPKWKELTRRLRGTGLIVDDEEIVQKILAL
ncbi:DUF1028 domain-containing protein [candidate division KSB1 bacterium]|nr:DUF1028 domain-containing protein [candidate division KSB1 bacterium]RQW04168.1 MAG: DUF1028 domain-containing protein [candidate division KSB1 bacterium]